MSSHAAPSIGIMQGRLVPPQDGRFQSFPLRGWQDEFGRASAASIDAIEWIYDAYGESANPLATDAGIEKMRALSAVTGVAVRSVCADYFMDRPMLRADENALRDIVSRLYWLIDRCRRAGVRRIVLPFVDASRITGDQDAERAAVILTDALSAASFSNVELHLETSLGPHEFAQFLGRLEHPLLKVNYDSGNSASLGFNVAEEFAAYGARVGSVHIKDRVLRGSTVPLGTGAANFPLLFTELSRIDYAGDYVLQAARGPVGDETRLAAEHRAFVVDALDRARSGTRSAR